MTPTQIKRAKRLAEILGITDLEERDERLLHMDSDGLHSIIPVGEFNPEQDKALLWDLMVDNGLSLFNYSDDSYGIEWKEINQIYHTVCTKDEIPQTLIDCVIEINGGYDD